MSAWYKWALSSLSFFCLSAEYLIPLEENLLNGRHHCGLDLEQDLVSVQFLSAEKSRHSVVCKCGKVPQIMEALQIYPTCLSVLFCSSQRRNQFLLLYVSDSRVTMYERFVSCNKILVLEIFPKWSFCCIISDSWYVPVLQNGPPTKSVMFQILIRLNLFTIRQINGDISSYRLQDRRMARWKFNEGEFICELPKPWSPLEYYFNVINCFFFFFPGCGCRNWHQRQRRPAGSEFLWLFHRPVSIPP